MCLQRFIKAAEDVKTLKTSPNEDELLELYSLYKQGSIGDVNTRKYCCVIRSTVVKSGESVM